MRKMINKKGFSLVELMIVVVIMGILIAIAIPMYGRITQNSKNKTCASNIDTIEKAASVYFAENGKAPESIDVLEFDGGAPVCPWAEDIVPGYSVTPGTEGKLVDVACLSNSHHDS